MHLARALTLVVLAGCGRIGFAHTSDASGGDTGPDVPTLPLCANDDFSDGVGDGWHDDGGNWVIGSGPFGPNWTSQAATTATFTWPLMDPAHDVLDVLLDVDIRDRAGGDFFVQLINPLGQNYQISLFPIGSDDPIDSIVRFDMSGTVVIAMTGNAIASLSGAWSRIRVAYRAGAFEVYVDGTLHLSGVDMTFSPPFKPDIGFTYGGAFDNFSEHCQ